MPGSDEKSHVDAKERGKIALALSVLGSTSILYLAVGLLRIKLFAVLLGPAGMGVYGLLVGMVSVISSLVGLELNFNGIRQIAAAENNQRTISAIRWSLTIGNLLLGCFSAGFLWILREQVAVSIFGNEIDPTVVGLSGIAVVLTLLSGTQAAILRGLQQVKLFAWHRVVGLIFSTVIACLIFWNWSSDGIWAVIIVTHAANLIVAWSFLKAVPTTSYPLEPLNLLPRWRKSISVGLGMTFILSINAATILFLQSLTLHQSGAESAGHLQAVLTFSRQYFGFFFLSIFADFFPSISKITSSPQKLNERINKQIDISLLLLGPLFIAVCATTTWFIPMLFSSKFEPSSDLMGWWVLGDLMTIPSWILAISLLSLKRAKAICVVILIANAAFLMIVQSAYSLGYPLTILSLGWLVANMVITIASAIVLKKETGLMVSKNNMIHIAVLLIFISMLNITRQYASIEAAFLGLIVAAVWGTFNLRKIIQPIESDHWIVALIRSVFARVGWPIKAA